MRVFARLKRGSDNCYFSINIANAVFGFQELGVEIIPYHVVDEIYDQIEKEDIVLDGIAQCNYVFDKFATHPELYDYPEALQPFMGRNIWTDNINHINANPELWNCFVKPVKHKAFTGRVIREPKDLIGCGSQHENFDVICTDIVDIKHEWRAFVLYDRIVDIRPYKGNYHYNYNPAVIDKCLEAFKTWEDRPAACSLDFAVIVKDGREQTVFLEANDSYALGCYGLYHLTYAKLIAARWAQVMGIEDEFKSLRTWE